MYSHRSEPRGVLERPVHDAHLELGEGGCGRVGWKGTDSLELAYREMRKVSRPL